MEDKNFPVTPEAGYQYIVDLGLRYCEAESVKKAMQAGLSFQAACTQECMLWLEGEENSVADDMARDGYYQCSMEFSQFLHFLEEAGVISFESEMWKRACKLEGF